MRGVTGDLAWSEWCESILEEYVQFVRAHGRAPSQRAEDEAERNLYAKFHRGGAKFLANRELSSAHALKLR